MKTNSYNPVWTVILAATLWGAVGMKPALTYAQKSPAPAPASPADQDIATVDAERGALDRFLDSHPEIKSDVEGRPAAMSDQNYLKEHSELQAFLDSHPPIKADPRAFLSPATWGFESRRSDFDMVMSYLVPFAVFVCVLLGFFWVLRTLLENRRWNRSFKVHEEVHGKLIEKFASGQDFSAYLQSDAGRRLLEWTPPALDSISHGVPNAVGRILWSLQAGLVLLLVGFGLLLLRGQLSANDAPPLLVSGTLGVTLGAGFILSALVSYGLSKHLGLIGEVGQGTESATKR
jgi:hypothetical protein